MSKDKIVCCTSPAAICYWFTASLIAWIALAVAGAYWHPLRWYAASTILLAMGIGCVANWIKNRSFHCSLTAPLFLFGGLLFLLADRRVTRLNTPLIWSFIFVGTVIAFLLEWRFTRRSI